MVMLDVLTKKLQESTKGLSAEAQSYAKQMQVNEAIITDSWGKIYKSIVPIGDKLKEIYALTMQWLATPMPGWVKAAAELKGPTGVGTGAGLGGAGVGMGTSMTPPKSLIAPRDAEQQAAFDKMRLETASKIAESLKEERRGIELKYDAEIAGELDADKRIELRKLKSAELAAFDKKQADEIATKNVESWKIYIDEREKQDNDVARLEGEQRIKSNEEAQKAAEEYAVNWGKAIDAESEMMKKSLVEDAEIKKKVQTEELEGQIKVNDQATEAAKKYYAQRFNLCQITASELARVETQLENSRYGAELSLLDQLTSLYQSDREKYQQYLNQKKEAVQKNSREIQTIEASLADENKKTWQGLLSPISSAISTSITGIIMGTTTLQKALANLFQSILLSFVEKLVSKMVEQWAVAELAKINLSEASSALISALFGQQALTAIAAKKAEAAGVIPAETEEAAMGAAAAMASVPYAGPALAVAAAAAMEALGAASLSLASAQGGWDVDRGGMAMIHDKEMVLPADLAVGIRNIVSGGQGGGGWKPNNKTFRDMGKAFGLEQGKAFTGSLRSAARNLGFRR